MTSGSRRRETVRVLNAAFAAEIVRVVRGGRRRLAADILAERIVRLGGEPDYSAARQLLRGRSGA